MRDWWIVYVGTDERVHKVLVKGATAIGAGLRFMEEYANLEAGAITSIILADRGDMEGMGLPTGPEPKKDDPKTGDT